MNNDIDLPALAFVAGGLALFVLGLLVASVTKNSDLLEECRRTENVNRCVIIAIPANTLPLYEEY